MKEKIRRYVDNLFSDIYDTKQLRELKEEISYNLLEKVNDFISRGEKPEIAFNKAVSSLGDMSELVGSLRKASEAKYKEEVFKALPLDKKHVLGYVIASAIILFGLMVGGIVYLQQKEPLTALASLMPFLLVSAPIYIYMGLTQETNHDYGMNSKRAFAYTIASETILFGAVVTGIVYFNHQAPYIVLSTLMPFVVVSAILFIYLGLTEKSRRKMGSEWEKQWVEYYSNPQTAMVRGTLSGALWIFSIAAFFLVAFIWGWKYSWIVFIIATGFEVLIEAYMASTRKKC